MELKSVLENKTTEPQDCSLFDEKVLRIFVILFL